MIRWVVTSRALVVTSALLVGVVSLAAAQQVESTGQAQCQPTGSLVRLADLPEASGIAVSRRVPGRLWTHNDSGQPIIFALDASGKVTVRVQVKGAAVEDWEAIAVGPCSGGSCLFVADIGDNGAERRSVTVYRIPEPAANETTVAVGDAITASYPDGPHDAETLLVTPDGGIFIVTKGETGPVSVYRVPANARPGAAVKLERIGEPIHGKAASAQRITDGAVSADGEWVVLRSLASLTFYRAMDFAKGDWREARRVDLRPLREPQGEGVALGAGNTVYVLGEGGGKKQPGTLGRFTCEL